jgi:phenylpropionate dioxygenase-like ring-hydroxylating dioxygenase large terminal subunit
MALQADAGGDGRGAIDLDILVQDDRVHRTVYTDPGLFQQEMARVFERTWVFVGHESEVPHPGDYRTTTIGRQPVILSRHSDGQVYVLLNRCMHRGAVVCREERGNSSIFRCIYHGWMYNARGDLVGVPFPGGYGDGLDAAEWSLRRAPRVGSYRGFVFASLAPTGEDLPEYLGRARAYMDLLLDAAPAGTVTVRSGVERYAYPANWKLQIENLLDGYHPNFTHQIAFELSERRRGTSGRRANSEGSGATARTFGRGHGVLHYGAVNRGYAQEGGLPPAYIAALEAGLGPARAAAVLAADIQLFIFPNLFFQGARQHYRVVRPVAVDHTEVHAFPYTLDGAPEELNRRRVRGLSWWASPAAFGQPDDLEAFVRCQEGLQVTAAEWVLFSRGIQRERMDEEGEVVGDITDEVPQRGIYREWKRLMRGGVR